MIPGLTRCLGEGNDNPLQYSCLENPMDIGAWQATIHGVAKSWTPMTDFHLPSLQTSENDLNSSLKAFSDFLKM